MWVATVLGVLVLAGVLAWGIYQTNTRSHRRDAESDAASREAYKPGPPKD